MRARWCEGGGGGTRAQVCRQDSRRGMAWVRETVGKRQQARDSR